MAEEGLGEAERPGKEGEPPAVGREDTEAWLAMARAPADTVAAARPVVVVQSVAAV
jgi:hypothetical protein